MKNRGWLSITIGGVLKGSKLIAVIKSAQILKVLLTLVSMLLSIITYGLTFGLWFGIGLVGVLFVHEMGHVIALRIKKLPTSLPVFIPFLGAAIFVPKFESRDTESYVGYGGPLVGSMAVWACVGIWFADGQQSDLLFMIGYLGIYLNLFNMIPVSPLDGGRIMQSVGNWVKYVGAVVAISLVFASRDPGMILLLILILDGFSLPLLAKPVACVLFTGSMVGLMNLGYGERFWLDFADAMFAGLFTAAYVIRDFDKITEESKRSGRGVGIAIKQLWMQRHHNQDGVERGVLPMRRRILWLTAYVALTVALGGSILLQDAVMPVSIQHRHDKA